MSEWLAQLPYVDFRHPAPWTDVVDIDELAQIPMLHMSQKIKIKSE